MSAHRLIQAHARTKYTSYWVTTVLAEQGVAVLIDTHAKTHTQTHRHTPYYDLSYNVSSHLRHRGGLGSEPAQAVQDACWTFGQSDYAAGRGRRARALDRAEEQCQRIRLVHWRVIHVVLQAVSIPADCHAAAASAPVSSPSCIMCWKASSIRRQEQRGRTDDPRAIDSHHGATP